MPHQRVVQLGASTVLVRTIRVLQGAGYEVHAVDRDPEAPGLSVADHAAPVDFGDVDALTDYARQVAADVLLPVNEPGVMPAVEASHRLGLPGISRKTAIQCLNKGVMRDCWAEAGLGQPDYRVVSSPDEIGDAAKALGFPVIVKPTLGWGSRGVSPIRAQDDLEWSVEFVKQYAPDGECIVERFIEGTEMTIEGLVRDGQAQVLAKSDKEHQEHHKYRVAMALNYPAAFPPEILAKVDDLVARAVAALDHRNGVFHCECLVKGEDVFLLECAARGGGGLVFSRIVEAVSGVCMPAALLQILFGEDVDIKPRYQRGACYKFFAPPPGVFREIRGFDEARFMPGILDFEFAMAPGSIVEPVEQDADRPGLVVSTGATRDEAIANAERAIDRLQFVMG